jgi:hypothetical protein
MSPPTETFALALSTLELRWFFTGSLDETGLRIEEWFRTRPLFGGGGRPPPLAWDPAPPVWREDRYLLVPGHDDMGIKWREGRLEIKGREAAPGHRALAPGIEGMCERWVKWSYVGAAIERRFRELFRGDAGQGIVPVEKRRLQRLLRLDDVGEVTEVERDQPRARGVTVELAEIRVGGSPGEAHWSLAFEAFPGDGSTSERLASVVTGFLEGCPALPLSAEQSMSYPRWLLDLHREITGPARPQPADR